MKKQPELHRRDAERGPLHYGSIRLERRELDTEARTVPAILSTGAERATFMGREALELSEGAVNLEFARNGIPLLDTHDQRQRVGRVSKVRLEDGALRGLLRFSRSQRGEEAMQDVADGILREVSIGYSIEETEPPRPEFGQRFTATKWTPREVSLVAIPADPGAIIGRDGDPDPQPAPGASSAGNAHEVALLFRDFPEHQALMYRCLEEQLSVDAARALLLDNLGARHEPTQPRTTARAGDDHVDKSLVAMTRALDVRFLERPREGLRLYPQVAMRAQAARADHDAAHSDAHENPFTGLSLVEMAREYLANVVQLEGARSLSASQVVDTILSGRPTPLHSRAVILGHGPSDFTNILANNIGKQLLVAYVEAPETWQQWTVSGRLNDMRSEDRPNLSTFGDLDDVTDEQEYKYGTLSDKKETIIAKRFGKLFSITRTALLNDDQNAFQRIPAVMGRAAARMVGDEVYTRLTANAALNEDSTALFHANHSNLVASGTAPTVAALNTMLTNMATQTDPGGNVLNIRPAFIITPWALWGTTRTLLVSAQTPGGSTNDANIWQSELEQVTEARLDASSAVQWYIAARGSAIPTIEVSFVDGVSTPFLAEEEAFTRDGRGFKVRLEFGTAVLDFRGLAKNNGT